MEFKLKGDYINGQFKAQNHQKLLDKLCPGDTSMKLYELNIAKSDDVSSVEAADSSSKAWRRLGFEKRAEYLRAYQVEVEKRANEIAKAIALETGKPLWEAKTEATALKSKVSVTLADSFERIKRKTLSNVMPAIDGHILSKPLGVCLVIGPFNFPCHLANGQILSALLTGNPIVFKPSEKTAYSTQLMMECFDTAKFPPGVINLVQGGAETTQTLLKHPAVKGIYFTGSYPVGKAILNSVGADLNKLVALELGGKNATIIHKDCKQEHGLAELLRACFLTAGQRCTSTSNIFIHRDIEQEFITRFVELTKKVIVGHPLSELEPFMGPLIDDNALQKFNDYTELGVKNGAKILFNEAPLPSEFKGHYVSPHIHRLDKIDKKNPFALEEVFGPSCCFITYDDIDEAIDAANMTEYGLAASVFTQDKALFEHCLEEIEAGIINLNRSTVGASARLPFGGVKNSGNFRPAGVSIIDFTCHQVASLETLDESSNLDTQKGLRN